MIIITISNFTFFSVKFLKLKKLIYHFPFSSRGYFVGVSLILRTPKKSHTNSFVYYVMGCITIFMKNKLYYNRKIINISLENFLVWRIWIKTILLCKQKFCIVPLLHWVKVQKWVKTITPGVRRGNKYFRAQFWDWRINIGAI